MKWGAALALAASTIGAPLIAQTDRRIEQVETNLGTAVEIAGRPSPKVTLANKMRDLHVPGVSIAVIQGGRIAWAKGYGKTSGNGGGVTTHSCFQAGSISKSIAALAALRLAAEGKLVLDRPVNDFLKSWKLPDGEAGKAESVTLRGLLSHTAGLNVHGFPGYPAKVATPSVVEILDGRPPTNTPPIRITYPPNTAWNYSGGGYLLAQQLIEDVTGQSFTTVAKDAILVPAEMQNSSFDQKPACEHALGHDNVGVTTPGGYHVYPEMAAAGLWTTAPDLARAMLSMPADMIDIVLTPIKPGHSVGFDTGGAGVARWISKGGDTEGFAAFLVFYPLKGEGAVVMTNGAQGTALAGDVIRSVASAYGWPDFGPHVRNATAVPSTLLALLPGTYRYRGSNSFTIARSGDDLVISSPGETPETLYADPSGEFFTLTQDVAFLFEPGADTGHIAIGDTKIAFSKEK